MFTGIIHGQGEITTLRSSGSEMRLAVRTFFALDNVRIGESIAVNGVCLTVESGTNQTFTAYASAETMQCTNLGLLHIGGRVNLERALAVGDRLGGHIVSGHVDCLAKVASIEHVGQSRCIRITFPSQYAPEILAKGSVTLDGISLTVNACGSTFLEVNVIPETWAVTTVGQWSVGSTVNLETDIIGKYVRHMLKPWHNDTSVNTENSQTVTEALLQEHGFI